MQFVPQWTCFRGLWTKCQRITFFIFILHIKLLATVFQPLNFCETCHSCLCIFLSKQKWRSHVIRQIMKYLHLDAFVNMFASRYSTKIFHLQWWMLNLFRSFQYLLSQHLFSIFMSLLIKIEFGDNFTVYQSIVLDMWKI